MHHRFADNSAVLCSLDIVEALRTLAPGAHSCSTCSGLPFQLHHCRWQQSFDRTSTLHTCCAKVSISTNMRRFGITSFVYRRRKPFHPQRLRQTVTRWMPVQHNLDSGTTQQPADNKSPIATVMRSKGFMWLSSGHATAFYWSHAGQHFEIRCVCLCVCVCLSASMRLLLSVHMLCLTCADAVHVSSAAAVNNRTRAQAVEQWAFECILLKPQGPASLDEVCTSSLSRSIC